MRTGAADPLDLHRPRPAGDLEDRLRGIDQPGAEIRVLRERTPGRGHGEALRQAERTAECRFMVAGLAVELDEVEVGESLRAAHG